MSNTSSDEDTDMQTETKEVLKQTETDHRVGYNYAGYTILPDVTKKPTEKATRKLPRWIEEAELIESDINDNKKSVTAVAHISDKLQTQLANNGISHLFPVQCSLIPAILQTVVPGSLMSKLGLPPSDICCSAPTGSGKTLAFVLPIIQVLDSCVTRKLRALVVLPVADLAEQVYKVFLTYSKDTKLKIGLTIGKTNLQQEQESITSKNPLTGELHSAVDILVATPGRLVDHLNFTKGLDLCQLRFLVLDEVDRMLEEIKHDWLNCLERAVYETRGHPPPITAKSLSQVTLPLQKLLFSATLTENPEKLEKLNLCQPRLFVTRGNKGSESGGSKYTTPTGLKEFYTECRDISRKPLVLLYMIYTLKLTRTIIFAGSQETASRLYNLLSTYDGIQGQQKVKVELMSGGISKKKRSSVLKQFSNDNINILITTDVMTRGIDVEDCSAVISYDMPPYIKTYIHRVGRTARAGKSGVAYTILHTPQVPFFRKMFKAAGKSVKAKKVSGSDLKPYRSAVKEMTSDAQ